MIRVLLASVTIGLVLVIVIGLFLRTPSALPARFAPEDCLVVELAETDADDAITGIEDLALMPDGDRLVLSAFDRRDPSRPDGGLYSVSLASLSSATRATAKRLDAARAQPFRPHGIAVSADGRRLAVINHHSSTSSVEIGPLDTEGWAPDREIADPRFCRANDLVFVEAGEDEALRVTIDRADCRVSIRDLIGGTGSVALIRGDRIEIEEENLNFPNGIVEGWIAETRARRLSGAGGADDAIDLPGGPDNLDQRDGRITAALHPHLLRTGLFIAGWLPRAGSRIVSIDPESHEVETLFDDPEGIIFAGATAAVFTRGRLIAGAARDSGLLYCEAPE